MPRARVTEKNPYRATIYLKFETSSAKPRMKNPAIASWRTQMFALCCSSCIVLAFLLLTIGCEVERRKTDAELGLNPQQIAGRHVYDAHCDRCHEPYSSRGKQGPSMKGVFKKSYLELSGLPANDERVREIILYGRSKMPGYNQTLTPQQVDDLLAYLHTL
jgi:cytochrome c2